LQIVKKALQIGAEEVDECSGCSLTEWVKVLGQHKVL